jgi:hypothetical protein
MACPAAVRFLDFIRGGATGVIVTPPWSGSSDSSSPASLNLTTRTPAGRSDLLRESSFNHWLSGGMKMSMRLGALCITDPFLRRHGGAASPELRCHFTSQT